MNSLFLLVWTFLRKIQRAVMIFTSVMVVVLILVQVALRYLFKLPLMGIEELTCMAGFWLYFTGAAQGAMERSHIRADLLQVFIKDTKKLFLARSIGAFIVVILAGIMCSWTLKYFQWSLKSWERSPALMIPMVYAQASLLISSFLMCFYFIVEFVDYFRQGLGKPPFELPYEDPELFSETESSSDKVVPSRGKEAS